MKEPGKILILGAGPTGLGAALRLQELGHEDFEVLEARPGPGGLASSCLDRRGFTWDVGGHVQFSHYATYDRILDRVLGDGWLEHERDASVRIRGRFVPYPFQYNLHLLDEDDRRRALAGLAAVSGDPDGLAGGRAPADFLSWIRSSFGEGIADLFMIPYNEKVWGFPLDRLGTEWIGERVAAPDLERIERTLREGRDDISWGPNRSFRYPRRGGTGAIWEGVARLIDPERFRFGTGVEGLDLDRREIRLADGRTLGYGTLISSLPLDALCGMSVGLPEAAARAARGLHYSSCHILGVGLRGARPETLRTKCWMYFPEAGSPYHRVTVLSNYSPENVPPGGDYWSLMAEVTETPFRSVDASRLESSCLEAMRSDGLIGEGTEVVSLWRRREEHGYPTPVLGRDRILEMVLPELEERRVFSRGRFGAWKYEVSNQDHSFMQGWELVERLLGHGEEITMSNPERVNR